MPEQTDIGTTLKTHPAVVEYRRRLASQGGHARAAAYTPAERSAFLEKAWRTRRKNEKARKAAEQQ